MKRLFKSTVATFLAMIMMLSMIIPVMATEQQTPDISEWAIEALHEGEKFGIFPMEWYYDGFRSEIPLEKLETLLSLTEEKIAALNLEKNKNYKPVSYEGDNSRGDIINRLYNIVAQYDLPVGNTAVDYLKERKVLRGSSKGLQLEKSATTEQAVILAVRLVKDTYHLAQQGGKGVAWVVENDDTVVYLLGSIHVGISELYPFNEKLLAAFNQSDALLVEANLYDSEGIQYLIEKAMYQEGTTIKDAVSEEAYAKIEKVAQKHNLPLEQLIMQKPWTLSSTLSGLSLSEFFGSSVEEMNNYGVDNYFLLNALLQEKPIIELEGIKTQVDMFEGLSPEGQEDYLVETLDSILEPNEESQYELIQDWFNHWKNGDIEGFAKSMQVIEGEPSEFNKALIGVRDEKMAEKIMALLEDKEKGTYFVVVGSAHFLVDKTIRYHLEENGYDVKPFYQ
ncbi:TraB/GumN family protein [Lysinibacillus sp. LZ02]|uniref:TraB/GumN family protein n=1 Tax=Lysinibacillus sp. LZ02 TaxID=3420668 RepID=UPI003D363E28